MALICIDKCIGRPYAVIFTLMGHTCFLLLSLVDENPVFYIGPKTVPF